ncbi:hypothetical protein L7F22_049398 [Adiantum nelumboides]|nr:hypothetical protein [Adiantum nelumboides]
MQSPRSSAIHVPTSSRVAIKRITPFDHSMFCLRTLREIKLLRHFNHENIISILDIIKPSTYEGFNEELMETDMHRVIRTQELSDDHCQYFIYQTLRGLKALHSAQVLHRDLKPSNLLLNANCDLKICDFGLARSANQPEAEGTGFMTEYVATRWYRAPEIMLTQSTCGPLAAFWPRCCLASHCFPAETVSGQRCNVQAVLIRPRSKDHHQLSLTLEILGTPSLDDFYAITSTRSRDYIRALPFRKRRNFTQMFPNANALAVDLMSSQTHHSRGSLAHPYLEPYHDPDDEPTASPLDPSFFSFDYTKEQLSRGQLKQLIYQEIME